MITDELLFILFILITLIVICGGLIIEKYCEWKRSQYEAELEEWKHKRHLQQKIKRSNDPLWQRQELWKRLGSNFPSDTVIK